MTTEEIIELRVYPVTICDGCINLEGEACNTPGCSFIRCTTDEIKELLNQTQIRPLVNGEPIYTISPLNNPL